MKKFLLICGALFIALVVIGGASIAFFIYTASKLDASARSFADDHIPAIVSSWSSDELLKIASPQFIEATPPEQLTLLFKKLSGLGALKSFDKSKGNAFMAYTTENGKVVTANLTMHMVFESDPADFKIKLVQIDDQWQLLGFFAESPIFLK